MQSNVLKGSDVLIGISTNASTGIKPIGYVTSHTLSISRDMRDVASKRTGNWGAVVPGQMSWEMSGDCLYAIGDTGTGSYNDLFANIVGNAEIYVYSAFADPNIGDSDDDYKFDQSEGGSLHGKFYYGKGILTKCDANYGTTDNATYSFSIQGAGILQQVTDVSKFVTIL